MTDTRPERPVVGRTAMMLGFSGLLPQMAATVLIAAGTIGPPGSSRFLPPAAAIAIFYPLIILSFLGGIWWGFAMRRGAGQGRLAALAVVPSLVAVALLAAAPFNLGWTLVAIGSAVALTLLVDKRLVQAGDAPADWMRLRVPLSLGLGALTILSGALLGRAAMAA